MKTRYKFLYDKDGVIKSAHGREKWKIGEWQEIKDEPKLCRKGYHCSKTLRQAFSYIQGDVLATVEVDGLSDISNDKECYQKMRIVKAYKWTKTDSIKLAIFAARLVIDIYEKKYPDDDRPRKAIEAAEKYLDDPTDAARAALAAARVIDAAYAAARVIDAAYAAAYAADAAYPAYAAARAARAARAIDAAYAAAYAAADAAYAADAARAAALAAAAAAAAARATDAAARKWLAIKIGKWFKDHIKELEPYDN